MESEIRKAIVETLRGNPGLGQSCLIKQVTLQGVDSKMMSEVIIKVLDQLFRAGVIERQGEVISLAVGLEES